MTPSKGLTQEHLDGLEKMLGLESLLLHSTQGPAPLSSPALGTQSFRPCLAQLIWMCLVTDRTQVILSTLKPQKHCPGEPSPVNARTEFGQLAL